MYYFLKKDFEALNAEIERIADKIKEIGKEMGKSCQEEAETFHDNFAYEDGERQQYMWSGRIRELIRIRNQARVLLDPPRGDTVSIGRTVTVEDEHTGETRAIKIGSYMVLSKEEDEEVISYNQCSACQNAYRRASWRYKRSCYRRQKETIPCPQNRMRAPTRRGTNNIIRPHFFFPADED